MSYVKNIFANISKIDAQIDKLNKSKLSKTILVLDKIRKTLNKQFSDIDDVYISADEVICIELGETISKNIYIGFGSKDSLIYVKETNDSTKELEPTDKYKQIIEMVKNIQN